MLRDADLLTQAAALGEPTMAEKRAALAALVLEVLRLHDAGFAVEERIRQGTLDGADRADRVALMGDPARYAEVDYAGEDEEATPAGYGAQSVPGHAFRVRVWVGYADQSTYAASSQALFDRVTESRTAAAPGLLHLLRVQPYLTVATAGGGRTCELGRPAEVDVPELTVLSFSDGTQGRPELAHQCAFTITVR